jgi:hypothetical protein
MLKEMDLQKKKEELDYYKGKVEETPDKCRE